MALMATIAVLAHIAVNNVLLEIPSIVPIILPTVAPLTRTIMTWSFVSATNLAFSTYVVAFLALCAPPAEDPIDWTTHRGPRRY